jgi:hypothetical protein
MAEVYALVSNSRFHLWVSVAAGLEMMVVDCQAAPLQLDTAAAAAAVAVAVAVAVAEKKLLCAALQS